ncbi:MAG TPA: 3-deoxy-D-manno-octulosonic acid transferase, partial [Gemmataceae bacterium]|nr:3-deoxy-D-manno-octulosonic acid transferase [Gemmataceae bacterium]
MPYLLNVFYALGFLLISPWIIYKACTTGKYRRGVWHKLTGQAFLRRSSKPCAWFHGVSVGEIHLLQQVVAGFRRRHPGWECLLSTTTDTGLEEARRRFPDLPVCYWPLDFSWAVHRALRQINPSVILLAEGELWPNFLLAAAHRGVPVMVINGRMSPRSYGHYRRLSWLTRPLFARLGHVAAQTEDYAGRYVALGVPAERVHVTGSVKYDGVKGNRHNPRTAELRRLLAVGAGQLIWIAGSTQEPEEQIVLDIYRRLKGQHPELRLFLVPRQRERFEPVATLLARSGLPWARRSALTGPVPDASAVVLMDTIGELGALWGLADIAFVGGSLDGKRGGQNMIEPAGYGAAVVFGLHVWNF